MAARGTLQTCNGFFVFQMGQRCLSTCFPETVGVLFLLQSKTFKLFCGDYDEFVERLKILLRSELTCSVTQDF